MPKNKSVSSFNRSGSNASLSLSELHERKAGLEREHQWLLKQIKRKRTELKNFLDRMQSIATEMFHRAEPLAQQMMKLDEEIHSLFQAILQQKWGKKTLRQLEEIYLSLQWGGLLSSKLKTKKQEEEDFWQELEYEEEEETFAQTNTAQTETRGESAFRSPQAKQIRQTFRRLAEIFHPDKVTDAQTQQHHTEIMKEINRAYSEGDLARLLEIEAHHQQGTILSQEGNTKSDLERFCEKLESENKLLKNQYENLKQELNFTKHTPSGEMVKDYRACVKEGIDPIEQMLAQGEKELKNLENLRNFVRDFQKKKITLKEFLQGPDSSSKPSPEEIEELEEMLGELLSRLGVKIRF